MLPPFAKGVVLCMRHRWFWSGSGEGSCVSDSQLVKKCLSNRSSRRKSLHLHSRYLQVRAIEWSRAGGGGGGGIRVQKRDDGVLKMQF